jgi:hypothetical protein
MRHAICTALLAGLLLLGVAGRAGAAGANVCISIDEPRDTFSASDRAASLLLIAREFRQAGEQVESDSCTSFYVLSHVKLGNVIIVTLSGPNGQREGRAQGMDDLPALYNQMVRSILTGRPMTGFNVVDRTNVTEAQATQHRVQTDSFGYARLGYGGTFGGRAQGGPTMGFGYRAELDSFAVDVSFLNYQIHSSSPIAGPASGYYGSNGGISGSFVKLEGLHFLKPAANASAYVGGGLSWGGTSTSRSSGNTYSSVHGSGLQGELTVGYEWPRASTLRAFVQADAVLPFYRATGDTVTVQPTSPYTTRTVGGRQYTPSLSLSIGLGWQRHRR